MFSVMLCALHSDLTKTALLAHCLEKQVKLMHVIVPPVQTHMSTWTLIIRSLTVGCFSNPD